MAKTFLVTQTRSLIGCTDSQRRTMEALGLRGRHKSVVKTDTPANRGQILKVQHLVTVEVQTGGAAPAATPKKAAPKKTPKEAQV